MRHRFRIVVTDEDVGEVREWHMTERHMALIVRALRAYKGMPKYLAERFAGWTG